MLTYSIVILTVKGRLDGGFIILKEEMLYPEIPATTTSVEEDEYGVEV